MTSFRSKQRFSLSGGSVGRPAVGVAVHRANVRPRGDGGHRCWRWRCSVGSDQLCWSIWCCRPAFFVRGCSTASRSALLVIFNAAIAVWPMVALNVTLTAFNVFLYRAAATWQTRLTNFRSSRDLSERGLPEAPPPGQRRGGCRHRRICSRDLAPAGRILAPGLRSASQRAAPRAVRPAPHVPSPPTLGPQGPRTTLRHGLPGRPASQRPLGGISERSRSRHPQLAAKTKGTHTQSESNPGIVTLNYRR
jgi:hypothetical protein